MTNNAIILVLAYPETIVRVSDEWFSSSLPLVGIGKRNYVKAGHAALVLIHKETAVFDYFDFGRYTTPRGYGRVRSKATDHELDFPFNPQLEQGKLKNLEYILQFLATHPKLTHGEGKMIASVCDCVNYEKAKTFIEAMQEQHFVRYGVFLKEATNCSRFVTSVLIASVTDNKVRKKLIRSTRFTPSTISNVVLANTNGNVYEVSSRGESSVFNSSIKKENRKHFLDKLKGHTPNFVGNLQPKPVANIHDKAQWLGGVGAGAWFELHPTEDRTEFVYKRISADGNIDVHDVFVVASDNFNYQETFKFVHYSNCNFFHVAQKETIFRFDKKRVN